MGLVGLLGTAAFGFEVDDVAGLELVAAGKVVEAAYLIGIQLKLPGNEPLRVALPGHHIRKAPLRLHVVVFIILGHAGQPFAVVAVQAIELYHLNEFTRISLVGGIAAAFQAVCPPFVVGDVELEEFLVARAFGEEQGMVFIRILGIAVFPETLAFLIVVVIHPFPLPGVVALDAEMVVRFAGQFAGSGGRLDETLRQGDAGRNPVAFLVLDGNILVFVDIIDIDGVFRLGKHRCGHQRQKAGKKKFSAVLHRDKTVIKMGAGTWICGKITLYL